MAGIDVQLGTYTFCVTDSGEPQPLDNFDARGTQFTTWLHGQLANGGWMKGAANEDSRHQRVDLHRVGGHTVYGILESGEVGESSNIYHGEKGTLEKKKEVHDADMSPFYFQAFAPKGATTGVLVFQRSHSKSPLSYFTDTLKSAFRRQFKPLAYDVKPFIARQVLDKLQHGLIHEVKLTRYSGQSDLASHVLAQGYKPDDVIIETRIVAKKGTVLRANNYVEGLVTALRDRKKAEMPEHLKEVADKVTFTVKIGSNRRSMSFGKAREVFPYYDVTGRLKYNTDRHPLLKSIHAEADHLVLDVAQELGLDV